jgi:hypothetical protein
MFKDAMIKSKMNFYQYSYTKEHYYIKNYQDVMKPQLNYLTRFLVIKRISLLIIGQFMAIVYKKNKNSKKHCFVTKIN